MKGMRMTKWTLTTVVLLLGLICTAHPCWAEEEVLFADPNLQSLVDYHLDEDVYPICTPEAMRSLTAIGDQYDQYTHMYNPTGSSIQSLQGLEHAVNLRQLFLSGTRHQAGRIRELSALSELKQLEELGLQYHQIEDVQALGKLKNLKRLMLQHNRITDLSAFCDLRKLEWLDLHHNPLSSPDCDKQAALIRKNNPTLRYFRYRFQPNQLIIPAILLAIIVIVSICYLLRSTKRARLPAMFSLAVISGAVGCFLGGLAQVLYHGIEELGRSSATGALNPSWLGPGVGAIVGALVGMHYVESLGRAMKRGSPTWTPLGQAVARGIVAGLICSTLVHIMLMISYRDPALDYMLLGAVFGGAAGLILGLIVGIICAISGSIRCQEQEEAECHDTAS
jgi:hypothetical protein